MQREKDKDGVRFTSIALRHGSKAAGEEERPHLQGIQVLEVPQAVGDGASQLVDVEAPAAVGARGQERTTNAANRERQMRSQIH